MTAWKLLCSAPNTGFFERGFMRKGARIVAYLRHQGVTWRTSKCLLLAYNDAVPSSELSNLVDSQIEN